MISEENYREILSHMEHHINELVRDQCGNYDIRMIIYSNGTPRQIMSFNLKLGQVLSLSDVIDVDDRLDMCLWLN